MSLVTRPFRASDVEPVAALLAARHRRDRARLPVLPAGFESAEACVELVEGAAEHAAGVVAERAAPGRAPALAGFLFAFTQLTAPDVLHARFQPLRSALMFATGHAVDEADAPFDVYAALYAAQAGRLVERGIFSHTAHLPAGDAALDEAWNDLGFGRLGAFAVRDVSPLARAGAPDVDVHEATAEDIDVVLRLADEEARFHSRPPVFHAYLGAEVADAARRDAEEALASPEHTAFLGSIDGRVVGMVTAGPGRGSPLSVPDGAFTIGEAAVLEEARGRGVGATLVEHALAWGRAHERTHAVLHFSIANPVSRPFWLGLGFRPVLWHVRRDIDPRLTWARG